MKNKIFHFITLSTAALAFAGCVDTEIDGLTASQLDSIAKLSYLNEYGSLKDYVNRSENPEFKLGAGVAASSFINSSLEYRVAAANFDEVTAGNAMKYASCVADDGSMNFGTVMDFVNKAKEDGITIYGHTLAWHSQQNNKYLNSLLVDKELPPSSDVRTCLKINNPNAANQWDAQLHFNLTSPMTKGTTYVLKMTAKATAAYTLDIWGYEGDKGLTVFDIGTDYRDYEAEFTAEQDFKNLVFALGRLGGDMFVDKISLTVKGSDDNMIENGDFDEDGAPCFKNYGWHGFTFEIADVAESGSVEIPSMIYENDFESGDVPGGWGNGSTREIVDMDGGKVLKLTNPSKTDFWSAQMAVDFPNAFEAGTTYYMHLKIKGSGNGTWRSGMQVTSDYSSAGDFKNIEFTTEWTEHTLQVTCGKDGATRFIHSFGDFAGDIYIDDLQLYIMVSANSIPLTPEEKKDTLTWAMDKWIGGMMEACGGYVTTWDVVNEAISGGNPDSEGVFALQHSEGYTPGGTWDVGGDAFYWQDYLGDIDYVRTAVALARKHFAANGGTPADLKLFINDYNLESDWDDNGKVKSLVKWIERWEADDVTKIDGIGTQMHVSYYADANIQKSKEEHVVKMFEILAQSGKLIKISELDMGYIDASGNSVATENLTDAQAQEMAEYYKFIIEQYFAIIPAAQRYGITQWALTDSPKGSGWRGGEPIGLWTEKYDRKRTYGGFADGLSGK